MSIRYSRFVVAPLIVVLMLGFTGCKRTSTTTESVPQQDESVLAQPGSLDVAFIRVSVKVPAFSGLYFDDKHVLHVLLVGDASRTVVRNDVIDAIVRAGLLDRESPAASCESRDAGGHLESVDRRLLVVASPMVMAGRQCPAQPMVS